MQFWSRVMVLAWITMLSSQIRMFDFKSSAMIGVGENCTWVTAFVLPWLTRFIVKMTSGVMMDWYSCDSSVRISFQGMWALSTFAKTFYSRTLPNSWSMFGIGSRCLMVMTFTGLRLDIKLYTTPGFETSIGAQALLVRDLGTPFCASRATSRRPLGTTIAPPNIYVNGSSRALRWT